MAWDIFRVTGICRIASDIEVKTTQNGKTVANFTVCVGGMKKPDGSDNPNFFHVTVWGKTAELAQKYCIKGMQIAIDGALQQRTWNAQDGGKRSVVDIVAERIQFLSKPNKAPAGKSDFYDDKNNQAVEETPEMF